MADANLSLVADSIVEIGGTITDASLAEFELEARTWVEVHGVTDIGDFGDESEIATLETIDSARVRKKAGVRDAGNCELVVGRDSNDAGQIALRAAAKTPHAYAIRITANDAPVGGTPTVHYLKAFVASAKNQMGGPNDFAKTVFTLAIDAEPITVEAEEA